MYYKVYIDSVFLIQVVMNLYLLSITGKILKCTATHGRIFAAAVLGGTLICLVILMPIGNIKLRLLLGVIPVSVCMLRVAFAIRPPRLLIGNSLIMAGCGFLQGSIVTWILRCFSSLGFERFGVWILILSGLIGYVLLQLILSGTRRLNENPIRQIRIPTKNGSIHITALLDTGNHLSEPVMGLPVCIISKEASVLLEEMFLPERYHAIPFKSVGNERGILDAYELPEIVIEDACREIRCKKVILAICNTGISKDSVYQMILHPQLMKN